MAFTYTLTNAAVTGTDPAGTDLISLGDDNIRSFKSAMIERVNSRFVDVNSDPWIIKSPTAGSGNTQSIIPITDNTYVLGEAARRFASLFALLITGTLQTAAQPNITSLGTLVATLNSTANQIIAGSGQGINHQFIQFVNTGAVNVFGIERSTGGALAVGTSAYATVVGSLNSTSFQVATNGVLAATFAVGGHLTTVGQVISGSHIIVPATARMYLDGGSDTYLVETSANVLDFFVGGTKVMEMLSTFVDFRLSDAILSSTKRLYLDGGGDTYIYEVAANAINMIAGGTVTATITAATWNLQSVDLVIPATKKFYLDGGGDTYFYEFAANDLRAVVGGTLIFSFSPTAFNIQNVDLIIPAAKKLYLDGGSDTYIYESSANNISFVAGGTSRLDIGTGNIQAAVQITGAGGFIGNLTGTVLTAAQANITSLGTLTALTISGDLTMTSATSRLIPGVTGFAHRNNANTLDNFAIADNGNTTTRGSSTVTGSTIASGGLNVSGFAVSFGAADSAGAGFRWLRVPN